MNTSRTDERAIAGCIAALLVGPPVFIAMTAAMCLLEGYAIFKLWGWFAVPLLHAPSIGIAAAIGLSTLAGAFQNPPAMVKSEYRDNAAAYWPWLRYPFFLAIGYVIQRWWM